METTGFVHETTESKTKVKLGVGVHQLTLTVIDDAGMMSEPDTVVVTVERVGLPQVNHIDPDRGRRGEVVDVVVVGANLQDATAVKVYRGDEEDPRIRVTIRPGATQDKLPITLTILDHAGLGARLLEVVTARGVATAKFTVVTEEKPRILNITPTWMTPGGQRKQPARIEGDHLEDASKVVFQWGHTGDPWVIADIRQANREFVDVDVTVSANAAFGKRAFAVTAPSGAATNPPGLFLSVLPGIAQFGVMLLTLITALIHITLTFPSWLFILNGVGYLALLAALYWPTLWASRTRAMVRWLLFAYTALTIVAWIAMGDRTVLAYVTKGAEVLLMVLLVVESRQA
jgi:hypothetical protein